MYLSRIRLDLTRRETMRALAAPSVFHGAIESAFPGERRRRLWRLDTLRGEQYLLILSEDRPELSSVAAQFGQPGDWECKDYDPLLERIGNGGVWHFRLTANPVRSCSVDGKRGEVHAHITEEHQKRWLSERAEKHGFSLEESAFRVVKTQWQVFAKKDRRNRVTILSVTYEGVLTVTDETLFRELLCDGIGRGKAYGMGLMTVVALSQT